MHPSLFIIFLIAPLSILAQENVVSLSLGNVSGVLYPTHREFLGIPYAEPPLGNLRWKPPVLFGPNSPNLWTGTYNASSYKPICPQMNPGVLSEDCLYLNVYTPRVGNYVQTPLPVIVFVPGGAFVSGGSTDPLYNGGRFVSVQNNVILVSLNYRLGPLGFLALDDLSQESNTTGLYGLLDQRTALQWVKTYISAFGGDPTRVTLAGQSAGAISVCHHLVMQGSFPYYQKVIVESGPCVGSLNRSVAIAAGTAYVQQLGCGSLATAELRLQCLRAKNWSEVINSFPHPLALFNPETSSILPEIDWFPVVDGVELLENAEFSIRAGKYNKVPVLMGSNKDDGLIRYNFPAPIDAATYIAGAYYYFGNDTTKILSLYPPVNNTDNRIPFNAIYTDLFFKCPTRRQARYLSDSGATVFLYQWTYVPVCPNEQILTETTGIDVWAGAFHTAELFFWFDYAQSFSDFGLCNLTQGEVSLVKNIQTYWLNFVVTGNPNGNGTFAWPQFSSALDNSLQFNTPVSVITGVGTPECTYWDNRIGAAYVLPTTATSANANSMSTTATKANSGKVLEISVLLFVLIAIFLLF